MTVAPPNQRQTLLLAWGNPGRLDDGLGPALADAVASLGLPGLEVLTTYQLQVEHAWDVAHTDRVVFVDADRAGRSPFSLRPLAPSDGSPHFTSHELHPADVLALARDLYSSRPTAWLMGIRGFEFDEFGERLSERARDNLQRAVRHLKEELPSGSLSATAGRPADVDSGTTAPDEGG